VNTREQIKLTYAKVFQAKEEMLNRLIDLDTEQLAFKPDENAWSVVMVVDHIVKSEEAVVSYLNKKLQAPDKLKSNNFIAKSKAKLLHNRLRSNSKYKVPEISSINPAPDANLLECKERWGATRKSFQDILKNQSDEILMKQVFRHPVAGRMNILDTMQFMYEHIYHHLKQIGRIVTDEKFPVRDLG